MSLRPPVPVHPVVIRPLFSAYLYVPLALVLSLLLFRPGSARIRILLRAGLRKAAGPVVAMAVFGMMGRIVAFSGYDSHFTTPGFGKNMAAVLFRHAWP